jgi:hypothetical protein
LNPGNFYKPVCDIGLWCWRLVGRLSSRQQLVRSLQDMAERCVTSPFFQEHALINPLPLNAYTFDPLANLTSEASSLVLGGQHLNISSGSNSPDRRTSIRSRGRAQLHPPRCSGRVPGEMIVPRCHGCTRLAIGLDGVA